MSRLKRTLFLGVYFVVPLAGFAGALGVMSSCAYSPGTLPAPSSSSPTKHDNAPPVSVCPSGTVETEQDGSSLCCKPGQCESKGAPIYDAPCPTAGERRVGIVYTYSEVACATATSQEPEIFKATEQWVSVEYECRSEDGIEPTWAYVEPASHCTRSVARDCGATVTTTRDDQAGALCAPRPSPESEVRALP